MTERLYLADPYLDHFRARVIVTRAASGRRAVVLDRSAFYPEGGGQPGDRGSLGGVPVLDTQEHDGEVLHIIAAAPESLSSTHESLITTRESLGAGVEIEAVVDWPRRFDHMQQHHGQHLLSAAFERVHGAPTKSFHLGVRFCTIDLECSISKLDEAALRRAEAAANETVWRDLPVVARDFEGEERAKLTLRKEAVKGNRVVLVGGVDASPCGGTHPRRTGEVGAIAILRAQRWGEGLARIEFVCGGRVVARLAEATHLLADAAEALKAAPADLAEAARRIAAEAHARRKTIEALEAELAVHRAEALCAAHPHGPVVAVLDGEASLARGVASAVAARGRTALIAAISTDGQAAAGERRAHLVFTRPRGDGPAMNALLKSALVQLNGKGGGSPEHAQGSGVAQAADLAQTILALLHAASAQVTG